MFIHLCFRAVVHVCRYNLVQSCPCVCTIVQPHTLVPLYMHNCTQLCNDAFVLSCFRACTHAYIHAVVRLCGCTVAHSCACAKVAGRQGSEEIPAVPAYMMVMPSRT